MNNNAMYVRNLLTTAFIDLLLLFLTFATLRLHADTAKAAVMFTADSDCILVIDGKVTARLYSGHPTEILADGGTRSISAFTNQGDVWQQHVEVSSGSNPPITIPLKKSIRSVSQPSKTSPPSRIRSPR